MKNAGKSRTECTDGELLRRFRNGDNAAFDLLIGRCAERMERTALAVLGDREAARQAVETAAAEARRTLRRFPGNTPPSTQLCALVIAHCRIRPLRKA